MGLKDECGVVGIYGAENAARLSYYALVSLQHRGQESAGIAVSDGSKIRLCKGIGLVGDVFEADHLASLEGSIAVAHVRYATAGGRGFENAQPFLASFKLGSFAVAHNGQLVNHEPLRDELEEAGYTFTSSGDSEVILKLISREHRKGMEKALIDALRLIRGSYALCIMTDDCLIGVRDPNGIRPLCLGRIGEGWILASESCAIDAVNGRFVRDIEPGEIVIIDKNGLRSQKFAGKETGGEGAAGKETGGEGAAEKETGGEGARPKEISGTQTGGKQTCIFEYVYFARPDSVIDGISVQEARYRFGETLAEESAADADVVIGVPDSGVASAMGYARKSGLPYVTGIIKNKYIGRTFIAPTQKERESMVFVKLNAIKSDLEGKRVVVIDDSIVRGTTSRRLVQLLRNAGAREVHFRVSSPPVKFPCHLGIDTPTKGELISSEHDTSEICREIGADSLAFITLEGLINALRSCRPESDGFCRGCFNGQYPV